MGLFSKIDSALFKYFGSFYQRTLVQQKRKENNWEGIYSGKKGGQEVRATLIFTGSQTSEGQTMALGIVRIDENVSEYYDNITYHANKQSFQGADAKGNKISFELETFDDPKTGQKMNRLINAKVNHVDNRVFENGISLTQYWVLPHFPLVDSPVVAKSIESAWFHGSGIKLHVQQDEMSFVTDVDLYMPLPGFHEDVGWPAPSLFFDRLKGFLVATTRPHEESSVAWQVRGILSDEGKKIKGYLIRSDFSVREIELTRYR
jgi:hypothetical protein